MIHFQLFSYKDKVKTHQEARLEDHLKKRLNKREQRQKFHLGQSDSSRDADIDSSVQTANNTNIHFQSHNSLTARSFIGINLYLEFFNVLNNFNTFLV